ncbi:hypothetical protein OSB04_019992 [Centaurea solstitialis]|uniref:Retrovirus-related Pol polyprotein from transposon TNT 1-94-like beta-barrel domain-containing protein n=1 Tax=Centaurea solstitialis TaxID=347529 RepID=A0AA38ST06_9ASTR|nr:hypothetical protein OSB04_019992 [Centaurea solstitialis]
MAEVSKSTSLEIPTEVLSKLCTKACLDTIKKYRDHNQDMYDSIKRLEQFKRESNVVIGNLEDQIKAYQANELQFEYDQRKKVKTELDEAKSDIEKFSKASKAMDEILKSQIYDDLKRGIRYNITPPPYNNNYIPPKSDLFDRLDRQELKEGVSKVDPKDRVEVEDVIEENVPKIDENIPFENHILTNEKGGRSFVERKKIKGKEKNKFAQRKIQNKRVEKNANKLVKIWVPKAAVSDTTYSTTNSTSSRNTIDGSSTVSTTNSISTDNQLVNTSRVHKRTPLIVTRYSSQKIQNSDHLLKSKLTKGNKGRMKSIWHVDGGCSRHMTGIMSHLEDFKKFDGGHVAFGDNPKGGKISGKGTVSKGQMTFDDVYYVEQLRYNLISVSHVCDKKHSILFNDTECIILSPKFKIVDEGMILLRTPRKDSVYCLDLEDVSSNSSLNCLFSKASLSESSL